MQFFLTILVQKRCLKYRDSEFKYLILYLKLKLLLEI